MITRIELNKEETIELYMKRTKRELAEMLYECNKIIEMHSPNIVPTPYFVIPNNFDPNKSDEYTYTSSTGVSE